MFPVNYAKFLRKLFFTENLLLTASVSIVTSIGNSTVFLHKRGDLSKLSLLYYMLNRGQNESCKKTSFTLPVS